MRLPVIPSVATWALMLAAFGCQRPAASLPETADEPAADAAVDPAPDGAVEPAADPLPEPAPFALPDPGDARCAAYPTLAPGPAELACAVVDAPLQMIERLDADGCVVERIEHRLDARGNAVRSARAVFDAGAIGHLTPYEIPMDYVIERVFDGQDRLVEEHQDASADGVVELIRRWVYADDPQPAVRPARAETQVRTRFYDAAGRLVISRFEQGGRVSEQRHAYDADGAEVRVETWTEFVMTGLTTVSRDGEGRALETVAQQGPQTERTVNTYGAHGLARTVWTRVRGDRLEVTTETTQTRRPDGTLARQVIEERWFNGHMWREVGTYAADEEPERVERDEGIDGSVDQIRERWLEDGGLTVVYRTTSGQRVTAHSEQRFDAEGRRMGWLDVLTGAGVRFERDAAGRELEAVHFGAGGLAHRIYRSTYEGDPVRVVRRETDADADGVVDAVLLLEHDGAGRRVRQRTDWDADGRWDLTSSWHHDRAGHLVYAAEGVGDDPAAGPELHTVQGWRCPG